MSIQIIDGFQVNTALPIDNRIVASGSVARNAISYKYEGLRVFDTNDNIPYVWLNGAWVSENASGVVASGTTTNYIPVLNGTNIVGNSVIYQSGSNIGVNTTSPSATFSVNGSLSATTLSGNGASITGILGSNLNPGSIPVDGSLPAGSKIINGSTGQVLVSGVSYTYWSNQSQLSVGTASLASNVSIVSTTASSNHYLAFFPNDSWVSALSGTNSSIRTNVSANTITYNPGTNTLNTGTVSANIIKFPAVQIPSNDPNALDDYEEGTWTPAIGGVTSGFTYTSSGYYTKIGRVIILGGYIKYTSISGVISGSENNYLTLSSIPYATGIPIGNASIGTWTINPSSGTIQSKFFAGSNTGSGPVISSYQTVGNTNIYFSNPYGSYINPLSGNTISDQVVSFSLILQPA